MSSVESIKWEYIMMCKKADSMSTKLTWLVVVLFLMLIDLVCPIYDAVKPQSVLIFLERKRYCWLNR